MAELDPSTLATYVGGAAAALISTGMAIRKYLQTERVGAAKDTSEIKGFKGNDAVLDNLVKEVARLSERITELESKVDSLTEKLANVKLIALDCYSIATECTCSGTSKDLLLAHLKTIIKDS